MPEEKEVLTSPNPDVEEGAEGQEGQQQPGQEPQQVQIDWENDSNPYRKRYNDSQSQIQPLVRALTKFAEYDYQTRVWKPKTQAPVQQKIQEIDVDKEFEGYDPTYVKLHNASVDRKVAPLRAELDQLREERQASEQMAQYSSGTKAAQAQAIETFGDEFEFARNGKFNTASPLYKLANEILTANYAQFNPDGTFHRFSVVNAEYLATAEAYALLSKRTKQQPSQDKGKFGAIQGKGTKSSGVKGKLSFEEYDKLSKDEKDTYDMQETG